MSAITPVDPPELPTSPAFTQGMLCEAGRTLYVGGQNGIDRDGQLLDGFEAQSAQAMRNVLAVLAAVGAGPEHVVRLGIFLAADVDPAAGFAATAAVWGNHRTAVTVLRAGPARPGALVEIDAVAVVP
jgi:enamine deaminase RidA (YjgF/YER057c/UK114 family)